MAYEYVSDTFGVLRRDTETPYSPIEKKAIEWMIDFTRMRRCGMKFANEFRDILQEFNRIFDEIGHFDKNTPLWLNTIGGFHFPRWYHYQQLYWYYWDYMDELDENQLNIFHQLQEMDLDENFRDICATCLAELYKAQHPEDSEENDDFYSEKDC